MFIKRIALCLLLLFVSVAFASPVTKVTQKVVSETIEQAAKKSGKALAPAARKASEKVLVELTKQYGDDVLKTVACGGLEALEQGGKHGKIFWKLCAQCPKAARSLALHADDLIPIARRIGPDFMKLEGHVPGLGKKAVECFGDDAVKILVKLSPDDAARLIAYGAKADSPTTANMLLSGCNKTGGTILKNLDGKKILAVGLSASMVTAAYKVSDGVEDGIREVANGVHDVAQDSPSEFTRIIGRPLNYISVIASVGVLGFLFWLLSPLRNLLSRLFSRPKSTTASAPRDATEEPAKASSQPSAERASTPDAVA